MLPLTQERPALAGQQEHDQSGHDNEVHEQEVSLLRQISTHEDTFDDEGEGIGSDSESILLFQNQEDTKSTTYLVLLTLSMCGLQVAWAVELSSISPFLLELGLSKSLLAFVWIAGPLSGTLVQPYVGIRSDDCRYKRGRRRPFMIGGALATIGSLMLLSWTREIVRGVFAIFGSDKRSPVVVTSCKIWAVALVYVLDFAINVVQAGIRAFIVDCAPTHQQESANAIAGIITGIGGIIGYLFGEIDLSKALSFLGHTQFQSLCAVASIVMAATVVGSCAAIQEPDPRTFGPPSYNQGGVLAFFKSVFASIRGLPTQVKRVCMVQIFAWIGWFPFLFYITTYVGYLHANPEFTAHPGMSEDEINDVFEIGTRHGAFALLVYSITSLVASVVLPIIVVPTYDEPEKSMKTRMRNGSTASFGQHDDHSPVSNTKTSSSSSARLNRNRCSQSFSAIKWQIPGLTLRRAWLISHVMFAILMWLTLFVSSTSGATLLIALVGIPWALTNWAPFALIAAEISKRDAVRRGLRAPLSTDEGRLMSHTRADEPAEQAGIVLGIHNVAVSAPQVISTLISSIVFMMLQKPRGESGDESVGWVLRFGGLSALAAAWWTRKIAEGHEER
ncbi:MAG: hypothetical protein Q9162_000469 [Coniocarpon cinnabarinum]